MKPQHIWVVLFVIIIQALSACAGSSNTAPTTTPEAASPEKIVQDFYQAMSNGDLETALTFVAEDIECRGHCYITGRDSFQTFIQGNIAHHDQFELSALRAAGDKVTFNYVIRRDSLVLARGVDSVMQIQAGRIIYFEIN